MSASQEVFELAYAWPDEHWVRLNMVVDEHGNVAGTDGTSNSLSSGVDRMILKLIRSECELVIVGSRSVTTEGWHLPPHGLLAVVSHSQALPPGCPDPSRVRLGTLDEILQLAERFERVVCEGGKSVAQQLLALDVVDEICLTVDYSPSSHIALLPEWMTAGSNASWRLHTQFVTDNQAFTTWRRATE